VKANDDQCAFSFVRDFIAEAIFTHKFLVVVSQETANNALN